MRYAAISVLLAVFFASPAAYAEQQDSSSSIMPPPSLASILSSIIPMAGPSYDVRILDDTPFPIAPPPLPNIGDYTYENLLAKIPPRFPGEVSVLPINGSEATMEFTEDAHKDIFAARQEVKIAQVIHILSGVLSLEDLVKAVNNETMIRQEKDGSYLLRMPLHIGPRATLIIGNTKKRTTLRLSSDRATFVVNSGQTFIVNTDVTGWNEDDDKPSVFRHKSIFRPFFISWDGGVLHIGRSKLAHLGYANGKSYGLSYSVNSSAKSKRVKKGDLSKSLAATGWLIENEFRDLYYGFYCYEAEDVVILRNRYIDNIIYGIDPHDRSERLIIAQNEATGTHEKHGIIVSREVNNSWIFDNRSHHNHGSGIMLDRKSVNNVVAFNLSYNNGGDGITLFESEDNLIWSNIVNNNARAGLRVRNSWDIEAYHNIIDNSGGAAVEIYTDSLAGNTTRDFKLDPVTQKSSLMIAGGLIGYNKTGGFKVSRIDSLTAGGFDIMSSEKLMRGDFESFNSQLIGPLLIERKTISITRKGL